uniref:Protein quiver n=1 Tax=Strongyloides stercoralis TaxID=6248 RepID=A0A0K0E8P7_STRER
MALINYIFFCVIFIIFQAQIISSLECYFEVNGFKKIGLTKKDAERSSAMCYYPYEKCLKVSVTTKDENVLFRGCASSLNPIYKAFTGKNGIFLQINKCDKKELENGTFEYCLCDTMLCNSTSKLHTSFLYKVLFCFFIILNTLYFKSNI